MRRGLLACLTVGFLLMIPHAINAQVFCYCYYHDEENYECQPANITTQGTEQECEQVCKNSYPSTYIKYGYTEDSLGQPVIEAECKAAASNDEAFTKIVKPVIPQLNVEIPGLKFSDVLQKGDILEINFLAEYIQGLLKYLLMFSVVIAIILLMIGGVQYALGGISQNQVSQAKTRIKNALIGLVLLMSVVLILTLINPELIALDRLELLLIQPIHTNTEATENDLTSEDLATPISVPPGSKVPLLKQGSYKDSFGICGTIASSGCGPTSAAMVINYWQQQGKIPAVNVTPKTFGDLVAQHGYRGCKPICKEIGYEDGCGGMVHKALYDPAILNQFGLKGERINKSQDNITKYLKSGNPVIVSVKKSIFTDGGHFIVLAGVAEDGKIIVNDPNKRVYNLDDGTKITNGHVPPELVFPFITNAYLIYPKE